MRIRLFFGLYASAAMVGFAGADDNIEVTPISKAIQVEPAPATTAPTWSATLESDYTFGSRFKDNGAFGSQSEFHYSIQASRRINLGDSWFLKIGFAEEQFQFSRSNSSIPYSLTKIAGQIGIGSALTDSLSWEADVAPGVYFTRDHITANSFDAPAVLLGHWQVNPHLTLSLGVGGRYLNQDHVLPVGGLRWDISDRWTLNAGFPKTRLSYAITPETNIYVGGEILDGGFRNGPTDDRRTNNAVLSYSEERLAGGLVFKLIRGVQLDCSSGFNFQREFNYFHAGPVFRTKGAPFLETQLHLDL